MIHHFDGMSSDLESLQQGIVKSSKNKENMGYTVLLVGEIGAGKSSLVNFIATALLGKTIGTDMPRSAVGSRSWASPHVHYLTSRNGVLVSANIFECGMKA